LGSVKPVDRRAAGVDQGAISGAVNWNDVIPRVEEVMLKIENEIDQAERDEVTRYRGGSDGGDM